MLQVDGSIQKAFCDGMSRRRMLEVGSLSTMGLGLPGLLAQQAAAAPEGDGIFGRAKRVILLFMWGGPAHQDTWDMKPDGPAATRGEFRPIGTSVPGLHITEHMPMMSRHADKLAIIRSVGQEDNNHSTGAHAGLTGRKHELKQESFNARQSDFPHFGSVLSYLQPNRGGLPTFVALPEMIHTTNGAITPGQGGGLLGRRYDPFRINEHPDRRDFSIDSIRLPQGVGLGRMAGRRALLEGVDRTARLADRANSSQSLDQFYQRALDMVLSPKARNAFDLSRVDDEQRWRYGYHAFGQSVLMARRLAEAGVKLVTVYWHRERKTIDSSWDTHLLNFTELKHRLLPSVDRPISALLEDLQSSGMLEDTLVIWNSEFGRTPRINKNAGRDHWGPCNSVVMAGGGVPGGQVFGATDEQAAYPTAEKVTQDDIAATIYHLLGLEAETRVRDRLDRPHAIALGEPIHKLLGGHCRVPPTGDPPPRVHVPTVGPFETMLRENGNRFLCLETGNPDNEKTWQIQGLSSDHRFTDQPATLTYKGIFWNHFDYTNIMIRWTEPSTLEGVTLSLSGKPVPIPENVVSAGPACTWQIPAPEGLVPSIPTGAGKLSIALTAPGRQLAGLAVTGDPVREMVLERFQIA
tara:strand:- start:5121 stop:7022 length:1902 start_codon:yes stop_codon:yes gene_type:complete